MKKSSALSMLWVLLVGVPACGGPNPVEVCDHWSQYWGADGAAIGTGVTDACVKSMDALKERDKAAYGAASKCIMASKSKPDLLKCESLRLAK